MLEGPSIAMTTGELVRLAAWVSGAEVILLTLGAFATQRVSLSADASADVVWLTSIIGILVIPFGIAAVLRPRGMPGALASGTVACGGVLIGGFAWGLLGIVFDVVSQAPVVAHAWRVGGYAVIVAGTIVAIGAAVLLRRGDPHEGS